MATRDAFIREEEDAAEDEEGQEEKAASSIAQKAATSCWAGVGSTWQVIDSF